MKVLFKNKTKYTKEVYREFLQVHNKTHNLTYHLYTATILFLLLFGMVLQFTNNNYTIAILLIIMIISFLLWRCFHPISIVEKEVSSPKIKEEKEFTFKFFDSYVEVADKLQYSKTKYYKIYNVYETPTFFYIYIDRIHAFLLKKENFLIRYTC